MGGKTYYYYEYKPEYPEMLVKHLAEGLSVTAFAGLIGVPRDTLYSWFIKYPEFEEARKLFKNPDVTDPEKLDLKWVTPDYDGLKKFLVEGKGFNESRIDSAMKRIESAKEKSNQSRLDSFFKINSTTTGKRKVIQFFKI